MSIPKHNLTPREAAERLGLSKSYIDKLRIFRPEASPPFARIGRKILYPIDGLDGWLAERIANHPSDETDRDRLS